MAESNELNPGEAPRAAANSLADRLRSYGADLRRTRRERVLAGSISREPLRILRTVETQLPEPTGALRYRAGIARQAGFDEDGARRFLARAEGAVASWPEARPARFRGGVQFLDRRASEGTADLRQPHVLEHHERGPHGWGNNPVAGTFGAGHRAGRDRSHQVHVHSLARWRGRPVGPGGFVADRVRSQTARRAAVHR